MIFALTIDCDPLWCYRRIHGIEPVGREDGVTALACARFVELAERLGIPGTLFVVGETLAEKSSARAVAAAAAAGHEIGNHSFSHHYDLSRRDDGLIEEEIEKGAAGIASAIGKRPAGFRAPGYYLGGKVLPALCRTDAIYDSSVLPAPLYQGLKAAAMGLIAARGRKSGAILSDPRESLAPRTPYRPDPFRPWRRGAGKVVELPIAAVLGVPLTGGVLALTGPSRVGWLAALAAQRPFVCLELHGVDLMDVASDDLDPDLGVIGELAMPWERKVAAIEAFVERILKTHKAMTLERAARTLGE